MAHGFNDDKSKVEVYTKDDPEVYTKDNFIEFTGSISSVSAGGTASDEFSLSEIGISDDTDIAVVAAEQTGSQSNRTWLHYSYPYVSIRSGSVVVTVINNLSSAATISFRIIFIVLN